MTISVINSHNSTTLPPRPGDPCLRWDMRKELPREQLVDILERLRPDPVHRIRTTAPPEPRQWAAWLARGVVEILLGTRPISQVQRWVVPQLYLTLTTLRLDPEPNKPGCLQSRIISARAVTVSEGIVEACVVVHAGGRPRAVALRLEEFRGRWLSTALDIG